MSVVGTLACLAVIYWAANAKPTAPAPSPASEAPAAPARDAATD
ncbi:MAG: hypothetical protein U0235_25400 [Polyangiaceae bacterium]